MYSDVLYLYIYKPGFLKQAKAMALEYAVQRSGSFDGAAFLVRREVQVQALP